MTTSWYDRKSKGLYNVPGVPTVDFSDAVKELGVLLDYQKQYAPAITGLSTTYTIGGHTASGADFLIEKPELGNLALEDPAQFAISWTTYQNVYKIGMSHFQQRFVETLQSPEAATADFWDMIARSGTAYNLLILRHVTDSRGDELKRQLGQHWQERGLDSILKEGRLYAIDLSMFESLPPYKDGEQLRFNPATLTLLERDKTKKGSLKPVLIVVWTANQQPVVYTPQSRGKGTWLYALQAAKTSATLYGIWPGHVYHWHIVTAAMLATWNDNIPDNGHPLRDLLKQQSSYVVPFDSVVIDSGILNVFKKIAPPSSVGDPDALLKLVDVFAKGRQFFDDDPKSELEKNGLNEADFTLDKPWDTYPVARHLLLVWNVCETYVSKVVAASYADDRAVASDTALQNWMKEAANTDYGNVRGLPKMDNRVALARVLVSLVFRITMHGVSRLINTANPDLTWVANFPPCLQRDDIPPDGVDLSADLLAYLPNTGTIGGMTAFYYAFAFAKPQVPLIPNPPDSDLPFSGGINDARNAAVVKFRRDMTAFITDQYKWWQKGLFPLDIYQWPGNVEL